MAGGYLAQVQALIAERMKENPEEMKRKLKEIERAKKAPKAPPKPLFDPQLTQELIEELGKSWDDMNIQKVKDLIKRGADIKAKDRINYTVLHQASYFGDLELAKLLISSGAEVESKDNHGWTPLHFAVWRDIEIAKLLISAGADVDSKDKYGNSPLDYANSEEMKSLLREHGATI